MPRRFRVITVGSADASRVLTFYSGNPDRHLMPRDLSDLQRMAAAKSLYALEDENGLVVGAAYVHFSPIETDPAEFGGIFIEAKHRDTATALVFCALVLGTVVASHGVPTTGPKFRPIIAHTHVANGRPHKVLGALGFAPTGEMVSLPGTQYPTMRTSIDGKIWGVTHGYLQASLASRLAVLIRGFSGTLGADSVPTDVALSDDWDRDDVADALDALAVP